MFSLIVTIVAIALVVVLAVATIYYGGHQFLQGKARAQAAQYLHTGEQIAGAAHLYATDRSGAFPDNVDILVEQKYLTANPDVGWFFDGNGYVVRNGNVSEEICLAANAEFGLEGPVPDCSDPTLNPLIPCCDDGS